ncbi:bifunctional DNA-directed DNA polymerase [Babesia duncani]|uniref:DNA polymerase n=1 Tax=Babesia duncani TaxID=323732 RepID=A0AAD9UN28_9APIC|nr:bifunctional DNA-directed DNA polymerase [Babesia duncani]
MVNKISCLLQSFEELTKRKIKRDASIWNKRLSEIFSRRNDLNIDHMIKLSRYLLLNNLHEEPKAKLLFHQFKNQLAESQNISLKEYPILVYAYTCINEDDIGQQILINNYDKQLLKRCPENDWHMFLRASALVAARQIYFNKELQGDIGTLFKSIGDVIKFRIQSITSQVFTNSLEYTLTGEIIADSAFLFNGIDGDYARMTAKHKLIDHASLPYRVKISSLLSEECNKQMSTQIDAASYWEILNVLREFYYMKFKTFDYMEKLFNRLCNTNDKSTNKSRHDAERFLQATLDLLVDDINSGVLQDTTIHERLYLEILSKEARMAIQLVFYDFILSKPMEYDPQKSTTGKHVVEVPIIRIFGSTPCGQQVLLHVHGYLPYFYISLPSDIKQKKFIDKLYRTLEKVAYNYRKKKKNKKNEYCRNIIKKVRLSQSVSQNSASFTLTRIFSQNVRKLNIMRHYKDKHRAYIHKIQVEEHISFYGYNTKLQKFAKIYLYDPNLVQVLAGYCIEVGIYKRKLQPYEAHISYLIHFLSDYNIKGIDYVFISSPIKIRCPIPREPKANNQVHSAWQMVVDTACDFDTDNLEDYEQPIVAGSHSIFETELIKESICELEIDSHCSSILNFYETNDYMENEPILLSESFACGRYMGGRDTFNEQWKRQCIQLNETSISPLCSYNDARPLFVSPEIRNRFYKFLISKIKDSKIELDVPLLSACLNQLVEKWSNMRYSETFLGDKTTMKEILTINPTWFLKDNSLQTVQNGNIPAFLYKYVPKPPNIKTKRIAQPSPPIDNRQSIKSFDRSVSKLSKLEDLINSAMNFESGIVIDVITDIDVNKFHADPQKDAINGFVYTLRDHRLMFKCHKIGIPYFDVQGIIINALIHERDDNLSIIANKIKIGSTLDIKFVDSELDLLLDIINLFRDFDPNIIYGIDLQRNSIGYIHYRAQVLGIPNFINNLSRILPRTDGTSLMTHQKRKSRITMVTTGIQQKPILCIGRIMFDLYDLAKYELNLANNSFENIVEHVLGYNLPSYSKFTVNKWLMGTKGSSSCPHRHRAISYYLLRSYCILAVYDKLLYFKKYITFSRLHGVDLTSAIVRGSQYLVGAVILRFTKSYNYVMPSPTEKQVREQRPSSAIPIVMQPIGGLHLSPVAVLDFQSLYACITIAFNMCYSTCIGLLPEHEACNSAFKLGVIKYTAEDDLFGKIFSQFSATDWTDNHSMGINIAPNQVMFVDKSIREGILPRMLKSVLYSRIKIKTAMAKGDADEEIMKQWDMEQYGLKMLANLTIGLSSSGFSGKMPLSDLSEAVISTARALIVFCINFISKNFDAQVIYGDTDSLFIKFPGRSIEEARELSHDIANAINQVIPKPIKIIPQKIYCPCILVSKKRYIGLDHSNGQVKFDDKGVETMRRSECDATRKVIKRALELVMQNYSMNESIKYLVNLFKNVDCYLTPKDFILYKQIKLGTYRGEVKDDPSLLPAAARVAKYKLKKHYGDRMNHNEWVPHVFTASLTSEEVKIKELAYFPNSVDGIFKPNDYVEEIGEITLPQNSLQAISKQIAFEKPLRKVNVPYYLTRHILPPLKRIMQLFDICSTKVVDDLFSNLANIANNHSQDHNKRSTSSIKKINPKNNFNFLENIIPSKCICCNTTCTLQKTNESEEIKSHYLDSSRKFFYTLNYGSINLLDVSRNSIVVGDESDNNTIILCKDCMSNPRETFLKITNMINSLQRDVYAIDQICLHCTGDAIYRASCQNAWHCEVYFKRIRSKNRLGTLIKRTRDILNIAYTD